jgi:hypothetical protein
MQTAQTSGSRATCGRGGPYVLEWLNGRTWNCDATQSVVLPIALNFLNLAGPKSLPATRDQWIELLAPLAQASSFLHQLGERSVRLLGVEGVRIGDGSASTTNSVR